MGGPGYLEKAQRAIKFCLIGWLVLSGVLLIGLWWADITWFDHKPEITLAILASGWILLSIIIGTIAAKQITKPLTALAQAIMHVSPSPLAIPAPDMEKLNLAKELVTNLTHQVYEYAARAADPALQAQPNPMATSIQQLPVCVIGIDSESTIVFANPKAQEYATTKEALAGKSLYSQFDIMFARDITLEEWIEQCRVNSITAQKVWHGVRMTSFGEEARYCDLAASYTKQTEVKKAEVVLVAFDETETYGSQEQEISFIAMAVHELRAPLTILKGYIEVFEEELGPGLNSEMQSFMQKMQAAAENLTAFVGNILNVARVEQNQLSLRLSEENWKDTLTNIVNNMQLRAKVHGKVIELAVPEGLPPVGIDKVSIAEVVINLLDNAIKYSPRDKNLIKVSASLTKDNLVETTVEDFGVGIPEAVVPHLFEKYSRNHRNRSYVSGTGLGLYLSRALVSAHGGNIWVRSKEGQGTIFGFTIRPFTSLADEDKSGDNNGITRNAHGWIKNHSLNRQ